MSEDEFPVESMRLDELRVIPDHQEDFDAEACQRLLRSVIERGGTTVAKARNIPVSLEDIFEGNRAKHSIAANVTPDPPFDTAAAWYRHLKSIRAQAEVRDVLVSITDVEPYEDKTLRSWPYSDTVWIYSSLRQPAIAEMVAPLDPDEVRDAADQSEGYELTPPKPPPPGTFAYWVWWD